MQPMILECETCGKEFITKAIWTETQCKECKEK